jgi:hypothetical protein
MRLPEGQENGQDHAGQGDLNGALFETADKIRH